MAAPRIGLALGSGSARGWSHIGIIEALADAGIEADIVCGTSIGALVGAAYAAGRLADLRQWAEKATWREIVALMDIRLSGGGVVDGKDVVAWLGALGVEGPIESYAKRYAAIATDLASGREVWLERGPFSMQSRLDRHTRDFQSHEDPGEMACRWRVVQSGSGLSLPGARCRSDHRGQSQW